MTLGSETGARATIDWTAEGVLTVDGVPFRLMGTGKQADSADDSFLLYKSPAAVRLYMDRAEAFHRARVFEAGIFKGGSTAFFTALLQPERLVAIELEPTRNHQLDRWLLSQGMAHRVRLHYGVDQADRPALDALVALEFKDEPLDLVVDDASHRLTPTTATFNALFPRLRPGGLYIIEDWSWHLVWYRMFTARPDVLAGMFEERPEFMEATLRDEPELAARALEARPELLEAAKQPPVGRREPPMQRSDDADEGSERRMWRLVLDLVLAVGAHPEVVSKLDLIQDAAILHRGPAELDPATFDVADYLVPVGEHPS